MSININIDLNKTYLIGVSGGVDSVLLAHKMNSIGATFAIAHFDHAIRDDSRDDANMVREMARVMNVRFYECRMDIIEIAKNTNQGIEEAARWCRRKFLSETRENFGYDYVVLAHHMGDQTETILNNILRGPSIIGMAGMLSVDDTNHIIRPLLGYTKNDIVDEAVSLKLVWHEDSTNTDTDYDRNWLRHEIVPAIKERRNIDTVLSKKAEYFANLASFMSEQVDNWMSEHYNNGMFDIQAYHAAHPFMQGEIIRALWIKRHGTAQGFKEKVANEVNRWLTNNPEGGSRVFFGKNTWLTIKKNQIAVI